MEKLIELKKEVEALKAKIESLEKAKGRIKTDIERAEYLKALKKHYYVSAMGEIVDTQAATVTKNDLPTKELAEAFLALMQLMTYRHAWIEGWEPDWSNNECKHCVYINVNGATVYINYSVSRPLSFPTREMADDFINSFPELLEAARILL